MITDLAGKVVSRIPQDNRYSDSPIELTLQIGSTKLGIVVIDSIGEIEDIIISEATKGKFGIFIKNSNLDFQQIIPELEANSYLVDNYGDYIGIYW